MRGMPESMIASYLRSNHRPVRERDERNWKSYRSRRSERTSRRSDRPAKETLVSTSGVEGLAI